VPLEEAHLVALHKAGEHANAELAELFAIGRSTVYRALERAQAGTTA
jgi:DNA-binding IclR family transcriptional regulator